MTMKPTSSDDIGDDLADLRQDRLELLVACMQLFHLVAQSLELVLLALQLLLNVDRRHCQIPRDIKGGAVPFARFGLRDDCAGLRVVPTQVGALRLGLFSVGVTIGDRLIRINGAGLLVRLVSGQLPLADPKC